MDSEPYISVLVTAHYRKKYLLEAVRSALDQTLPRNKYEVIVVKNFSDDTIDGKLKEWGVTSVLSSKEGVGGKLYDGLRLSVGNVVAPLEDDDRFVFTRLQRVHEQFSLGVDYFHNGRINVNEEGKEIGREGHDLLIKTSEMNERKIRKIIVNGMWYNASSIALKRTIIDQELLRKVSITPDVFLLHQALCRGEVIVDSPELLTIYRIHSNNTRLANSVKETLIKFSDATQKNMSDELLMVENGNQTSRFFAKYFLIREKLIFNSLPRTYLSSVPLNSPFLTFCYG